MSATDPRESPVRLAIVVSHPIQHFVHFYRALAARPDIDLHVFYASRIGVERYFDKAMGTEIEWAGDMLSGYPHSFLPEAGSIKRTGFRAVNNPSIHAALDGFVPDALIVYGYSQMTQLRAQWWAWRHKVPTLMISDTNAVTERGTLKKAARDALLAQIYERTGAFLCPGDQNEVALRRHGVPATKLYRCPFTIDEARHLKARGERAEARAAIAAEHGIDPAAFVGLYIGKLIARKRPQDAIRAFAEARRAGAKVHLVLCGNGAMMEELKALAAAEDAPVTLAGFVNIDRLPDYYAAADALVHPAENDPHPLICSEAAAVGLPMILSDKVGTIGPTDVSRPDANTLVVPCGDVGALGAAIRRMADDPALVAEMGRQSQRIYGETDMGHAVAGVERALDALVRQGRNARAA